MKLRLRTIVLVVAIGLTHAAMSQAPKPASPDRGPIETKIDRVTATGVEPFMQRKLVHAKHVFEGVVLSDFDRIAKHGQMLSLLSLDSNWQVIQSAGYAAHSADFRRAADAIVEAARQQNADGAALAYVDLSMKCVSCHRKIPGWRGQK